jgi:hypothetical protein
MKIAFKKYSQKPENDTGMVNLPWVSTEIKDEEEDHYLENNWAVLSKNEYDEYVSRYNYEATAYSIRINNEKLIIIDLVHPNFRFNDPSKIDFTLHLQTGVLLKKEVTMLKNGRPLIAKYYHPDTNEIVAEIKFTFRDNIYKFMELREEWLGYYTREGKINEYYLIHKRTYDFSKLTEASESMSERVQARNNIIQELKIVINGILTQYYMALGDNASTASMKAIVAGKDFFNAYRLDISDFIEVASNSFKNNILNDQTLLWLNVNIQPGVNVKMYIADRITY